MPISTALPAVLIEVMDTHTFPVQDINAVPGTASVFQSNLKLRNETFPVLQAGALYGGIGGSGSTFQVQANSGGAPGNVFCTRVITTASVGGGGFQPTLSRVSYGPAADWNPGAVQAPSDICCVYNVAWATTAATDFMPIDTTGFCFIPGPANLVGPPNFSASLRTGGSPLSGFGMFLNPDGAGGIEVDYMAWDGAAVDERITAPAGVVTDPTIWNYVQFVIIGAANGRPASASMRVNGTLIADAREFGTDIAFPDSQSAEALQYVFGISAAVGGGEGYYYTNFGYDGRFTPEGVELQEFGA